MAAPVLALSRRARWETLPIALALVHGVLLLTLPSIPLIAIGLWWNANTVSHQFIHRPFFRNRSMNSIFSGYLSLLFGVPQSYWSERHLAHHRSVDGRNERISLARATRDVPVAVAVWVVLLATSPAFLFTVFLPGFLLGLGLCFLQGHFEHARGTTSHYGWLYNFLLFNDGYHVEHHARPSASWQELPTYRTDQTITSRWPAVLRWLDSINLCALERVVLRSPMLQRFVLSSHQRAFATLLAHVPSVKRVGIIGGGLFPRTALILRQLMPDARLLIIDQSEENLATARRFLADDVEFIRSRFDPLSECDVDLLVIPLAFEGDRASIYEARQTSYLLVHDWIWRRRGSSAVVSWLLLKRLNLITR